MYPVAAASFILFVKRIVDIFRRVVGSNSSRLQEPALISERAQSGQRMIA
jgi:hypothetical protein